MLAKLKERQDGATTVEEEEGEEAVQEEEEEDEGPSAAEELDAAQAMEHLVLAEVTVAPDVTPKSAFRAYSRSRAPTLRRHLALPGAPRYSRPAPARRRHATHA